MSGWPPRADEVFKCLWRMFRECTQCDYLPVGICAPTQIPVGICESICLRLDTRKEVSELWGAAGLCVPANSIIQSGGVELEDVDAIAFTLQRFAGHCGLCVYATLQTSPDDENWDTCNYAGFTNLALSVAAGLTGQCTLPITVGPKYIRAEIGNESMNDITIRAWLTLTKTC